MDNPIRRRSIKAGLPPGTLVYTGEKGKEHVRITVIDYDETHFQERELETIEECFPFRDTPTATWINIDGIHKGDIIESIGRHFGVHPLVLEDLMSTGQRPKMENYDDYVFIVLRMLTYHEQEDEIEDEQVSLIIGRNFVVSFQESEGDIFDPIRERIRNDGGRVRKMKADYLTYVLMDVIVDNYFAIVEKLGEKAESLEDEMLDHPMPATMHEVNLLRRKVIFLRKAIWPLREAISALQRGESSLFSDTTLLYFRDLHDHSIQLIDTIETLREIISDMLNLYLSSVSNRLNQIMKVLTIISTIFIPLTFIAGIYGMNFEFMPELKWRLGYPIILSVMFLIGISMLVSFKKRRWF